MIRPGGTLEHWPRSALAGLLQPGDLLVANDAATLPASLAGIHAETGRSGGGAARGTAARWNPMMWVASWRSSLARVTSAPGRRTVRATSELEPGARIQLGPLQATVESLEHHPRLAWIRFGGSVDEIWSGLARHGKPISIRACSNNRWRCGMSGRPLPDLRWPLRRRRRSFTLSWAMMRAMRAQRC